jgi:Kef-type K+ transport system membrane component KefB
MASIVGSVPLPPLGDDELLVFWCQLLVLLLAARVGGYLIRLLGQPRVIGELLAGVLLGPSVAGELWPRGWTWLFPDDDRQAGLLLGLAWFGVVLLLMTTGAETDLGMIRRQSRTALWTAVGSLLVPLGAGVALGWALPDQFVGAGTGRWIFAAFIGIALAISSLPVAARILSDLGLLSRPLGQLVLAVAMTNDVVGWVLLGMVAGAAETGSVSIGQLVLALGTMVVLGTLVLVFGGHLLDRALRTARRHGGEAPAAASIAVVFTVAVGAVTHAAGLEVVIGAFLAGMAIGRSRLADERALRYLDVASSAVFAPLFFAVAGLRVDLSALDRRSVLVGALLVTLVATAGKTAGAFVGARIGGMGSRPAFGASAALNARGALEIIVATVGLSIGVLTDASYTAIVLMAIVTSALAGPLLRWSVGPEHPEPRRGSTSDVGDAGPPVPDRSRRAPRDR